MKTDNLLIEIGSEELPANQQLALADAFEKNFAKALNQQNIQYNNIQAFVTPRRLGILVESIQTEQPPKSETKRGPALAQAFDANGEPTKAALGFARSNKTTIESLEKLENSQGSWLVFQHEIPGQQVIDLLPDLLTKTVESLPLKKRMRWGNQLHEFLRPVHWLVALLGNKVIPWKWAGLHANNQTFGHRFHHPNFIELNHADEYVSALKSAHVIVDFLERKTIIQEQIQTIAQSLNAETIIPEGLMDEVTGLVEWPHALLGKIDANFLALPKEVLITVLQNHQKCFALQSEDKQLLPNFIFVSNIDSENEQQVIQGNERVIRPRLADADFFFNQDKKVSLRNRINQLKTITYQAKLGSLYDKTYRLKKLGQFLATSLTLDETLAATVCELAKTDLTTELVMEFPELQGLMGKYYAKANDENVDIASALAEQYLPSFSGDKLPCTPMGTLVSLTDKLDTLTGIFAIDAAPTGDKDPFGLRRAAIGIIRILIEKELPLQLDDCFKQAVTGFSSLNLSAAKQGELIDSLIQFCLDRLRIWYYDQNIANDVFQAVLVCQRNNLFDFDLRIQAIAEFKNFPDAPALASANKRVANILAKSGTSIPKTINASLLEVDAEKELINTITATKKQLAPLIAEKDYPSILKLLTTLRQPLDQFFDVVMVMADEEELRNNRLAIIHQLRQLFLSVADISKIQLTT